MNNLQSPDHKTLVTSRSTAGSGEDDEIRLLHLLIVIAKHKFLIAAATFGAAVLAAIYTMLLPNVYTATTRLLPPQQRTQSSAAAVLGQLSGLAGMGGGALGVKNPADLYVGMLKSRTIADALIARFGLQALYGAKTMDGTRSALASATTITPGKDSLIAIAVEDVDPKRAATIANGYADELEKLTQSLALTEASQRRLFFERQLQRAKGDLGKAEAAARGALQKGGVAMVDEQGKSMIQSIARLRAQITMKEVEIGAMKGFATEQNPDFVRARQELGALGQQLARLEGTDVGAVPLAANSGGQGLRNQALLRDVKYNEALFELLAKQYELAKVDEAKDSGVVQVLDEAIPPEIKSKPKRAQAVIIAASIAGLLAVLWAFVREARERAYRDPAQSARLELLRRYASFR
jgi:tyrosine-protein kinase Etk/Wzc